MIISLTVRMRTRIFSWSPQEVLNSTTELILDFQSEATSVKHPNYSTYLNTIII